ncbi:hypothetical protein HK101_004128, partial [Irineochytrium annulatum]
SPSDFIAKRSTVSSPAQLQPVLATPYNLTIDAPAYTASSDVTHTTAFMVIVLVGSILVLAILGLVIWHMHKRMRLVGRKKDREDGLSMCADVGGGGRMFNIRREASKEIEIMCRRDLGGDGGAHGKGPAMDRHGSKSGSGRSVGAKSTRSGHSAEGQGASNRRQG